MKGSDRVKTPQIQKNSLMKQKHGYIIYSGSDKVGTIENRKGSLEIPLTVLLKYPPLFKKNEKTKHILTKLNLPPLMDLCVLGASLELLAIAQLDIAESSQLTVRHLNYINSNNS